jgi:hypothetical protein
MPAYRITEYDEDRNGHPSFLAEAITPSPLAPAVVLVRRPGGDWDIYRWDGTPWPAGRGPLLRAKADAICVAARKYRELEARGFYDTHRPRSPLTMETGEN